MHVVSVNVGLPAEVRIDGRAVRTGIVKTPAAGRVPVRRSNLEGDGQADPRVHGGPDMAVYGYAYEHYAYWQARLGAQPFPCGMFGENLTMVGYDERAARIGDVVRAGRCTLQVTQARFPCFKLAWRLGCPREFVAEFHAARRLGCYFRVLEEGDVAAGDPLTVLERPEHAVTVAEFIETARFATGNADALRRALRSTGLAAQWRERLGALLREAECSSGQRAR